VRVDRAALARAIRRWLHPDTQLVIIGHRAEAPADATALQR
jgi:hypothetical protein